MVFDLHSHTYYSQCGRDDPHELCEAAISGGIELFGICDHNYGITRDGNAEHIREYFDMLTELREEYRGRLSIARGIELSTMDDICLGDDTDISYFDYALIENIDAPDSILYLPNGKSGIFDYSERLGCKVGIAHTDLFSFAETLDLDTESFFRKLADYGIFWEMNVNCDSIHGYREHSYVSKFINSKEQQEIVRSSGIELSVGFDGHRVEEYKPDRISKMCDFLEKNHFRTVKLKLDF